MDNLKYIVLALLFALVGIFLFVVYEVYGIGVRTSVRVEENPCNRCTAACEQYLNQ